MGTCGDVVVVVRRLSQIDLELGLVHEVKEGQVDDEDVDESVKDILDVLAIVDVDGEVQV